MVDRMLIVDDEETVLFGMRDYFETLGYAVDCATDLATAKALLHETKYPLVIADLRLGGSDNEEGLDIIACAHERYPNARTVLLTAYGSPALTSEALRLGAVAVLNKPMSLPELAQFVRVNERQHDAGVSASHQESRRTGSRCTDGSRARDGSTGTGKV